jgi:predicted metal-dependent hydrolase
MDFEFPEDMDPVFMDGDPARSFSVIGLSLLLPYLEPYLIRTMKVAKKRITDAQLIDDLERFSAQEGQHYRMHIKFNKALSRQGYPKLEELEKELSDDYLRFSNTKSLRFNLAYAEGFEALTTAAALFSFQHEQLGDPDSPVTDLFAWHTVEEFEHRTVAFDIYDEVCGGYFYRLFAGLYAQFHFLRFVRRVTRYMLEIRPEEPATPEQKRKRRAQSWRTLRYGLPLVLRTYLPWYTPHRIEFTDEMRRVAAKYTEMAISTS